MEHIDYYAISDFIKNTLELVSKDFDEESIDFISHYRLHDEYEMSFEALFLEIMLTNKIPDIDFQKAYLYAKQLNLNNESIYDENFWGKFVNYLNKATGQNFIE